MTGCAAQSTRGLVAAIEREAIPETPRLPRLVRMPHFHRLVSHRRLLLLQTQHLPRYPKLFRQSLHALAGFHLLQDALPELFRLMAPLLSWLFGHLVLHSLKSVQIPLVPI
jgi:hypothetical protein